MTGDPGDEVVGDPALVLEQQRRRARELAVGMRCKAELGPSILSACSCALPCKIPSWWSR